MLSNSVRSGNQISPMLGTFQEYNEFYDLLDEVGEADFTSEVKEIVYGKAAEDAAEFPEMDLLTTMDYTEPELPFGSYFGRVWDEEEESIISPLLPLYCTAIYNEEADYFSVGTAELETLEGVEEPEEPTIARTGLEELLDEE